MSILKISNALNKLEITEWSLKGEPTNEEEFLNLFVKYVGVDSNNHAIESTNPLDFGVTWTEIQNTIVELDAEYEATEYQRQREVAYPTIQQQLDMQYWDKVNGTTTWQDAINAVKAEYPKP